MDDTNVWLAVSGFLLGGLVGWNLSAADQDCRCSCCEIAITQHWFQCEQCRMKEERES